MPASLVRVLLLLALALIGSASAAAPANAAWGRYIEIPGTLEVRSATYGEKSCVAVAFASWSANRIDAKVTKSGSATYATSNGRKRSDGSNTAPNWPADTLNHGGAVFTAPGGTHWVSLAAGWIIGGDDCSDIVAALKTITDVRVELYVEDYPTASFTAKELTNEPGAFDITSTAKDPLDRALVPEWTIDGEPVGGLASTFIHRFEKPGAYSLKHKVTNTEGLESNVAQQTLYAAAPELSTSIIWDEDVEVSGRLPKGEPIDVTVRVRAGEGVGALSDIEFSGDVLRAYEGGDLVDLEVPDPPDPFTLEPGQYRDFHAKLTGQENGEVTLYSEVTGEDAAGSSAYDDDYRPTKIGQDLRITVEATPDELALDFDTVNGEAIPKPVGLKIKIENVSGASITGAKIDLTAIPITKVQRDPSRPIPLQLKRLIDQHGQHFVFGPSEAQQARNIPLGDLAVDEEINLTGQATAADKARVRLTAIVRGVISDADGAREASGSGRTTVAIGQPKLIRVIPDDAAATKSKAGALWTLNSTIENVSPDQKVTVRVLTQKLGNTIGKPVDDDLDPTANPFGVIRELAPGERLLLSGKFTSDPIGDSGTRSEVNLVVAGWTPDEETGDPRELEEDEISIGEQPNDHPATKRVVGIDASVAPPEPWTYSSLAWNFTDGFARGFGRWTDGTIDTAKSLTFGTIHAATWMFYLPSTVYKYMSPLEREEALEDISQSLAAGYAEVKKLTYAQAKAAVDNALQQKFAPFWNAYETSDANGVATMAGGLLGETTPDLIIDAAVGALGASKLVGKAGKTLLEHADEAQEATLAARVAEKGIAGFEPADSISYRHARNLWGMDTVLDDKLRAYTKAKGIVIAMRDRSPGSIKRLLAGALGKIEKVKAKNVSELDIDYLGFHPDHLDFAMYKQMPDFDIVRKRVLDKNPGLGGEELEALLGEVKVRWSERAEEFVKESKAMQEYVDAGYIKVPGKTYGLNPTDNVEGVTKYLVNDDKVWDKRKFLNAKAGEHGVPDTLDGLPAFQPQIWAVTKGVEGFKPLTGDMDLIAIVDSMGRQLNIFKRLQVYRDLAKMGFQHPESLTWVKAALRDAYLNGFDIANGTSKALLGYMADGERRAVKFDSRKLFYKTDPGKATLGFMLLQGMRMTWLAKDAAVDDIAPISDKAPTPDEVPTEDDGRDDSGYLGVPGEDGANFNDGDDAPLLRENLDGTTSQWDPDTDQWVVVPNPPAGQPTNTVPQSGVTDPAEAGSNSVNVIGSSDLGGRSARTTGRADGDATWFAAGQEIVINPGGRTSERTTLSAVSGDGKTLTTGPLKFAHYPSETIAVVPKSRPPLPPTTTTPQPAPAATPTPILTAAPLATRIKPTAKTAPRIKGTVRVGRRVECVNGRWSGTPSPTFSYTWERKSGKKWVAIKKQTKKTLTVPSSTARRQLRCTVAAKNAAGTTLRSSSGKTVALAKRQ